MPGFDVGAKVRLSEARGGWVGFVTDVAGAPAGRRAYLVVSETPHNPRKGTVLADEIDVADGPLVIRSFVVGDQVFFAGRGGAIVADEAAGFRVRMKIVLNPHMTITRDHIVPGWQLALDN